MGLSRAARQMVRARLSVAHEQCDDDRLLRYFVLGEALKL
jgi:hypothetical protein